MKREELEKLGLSKEQVDSVLDMHHKEFDPVNSSLQKAQGDLKAEQEKVKELDGTIKGLKKNLEEFKDADVSGMKQKISDLEESLKNKDAEYRKEIADRDFQNDLKEAISAAHGKNAKAIAALLDEQMESLKKSNNRKEDISAALKALAEAEDSKMLFGEAEPDVTGEGSIPGRVNKATGSTEEAQMRAVMGLPPMNSEGGNK